MTTLKNKSCSSAEVPAFVFKIFLSPRSIELSWAIGSGQWDLVEEGSYWVRPRDTTY